MPVWARTFTKPFPPSAPPLTAAAAVDFDLQEVCFTDAAGVLKETEYTQPCMTAFAGGLTAVLREQGIIPDYAAGFPWANTPLWPVRGCSICRQRSL